MKQIKVNKIILGEFIDMLIDAYGAGADYIDLVAQEGNSNQDTLGILVREEYMNFERYDGYLEKPRKKKIKLLTIEKLNQLMNKSIN